MEVKVGLNVRRWESIGIILVCLLLWSSARIPKVSGDRRASTWLSRERADHAGGADGARQERWDTDHEGLYASDDGDDDDHDDDGDYGFTREEGEGGGGGGGGGGGTDREMEGDREQGRGRKDLGFQRYAINERKVLEWITHSPPKLPKRQHVFKLSDFGGVGDGKALNTEAFRKAIAKIRDVAEDGGAELRVTAGDWLTAPFNLTSHMTLYVEEGATILGSKDPSDYPLVAPWPSFGSGRNAPGPRYLGLINGVNLTDVVLTGLGTINGQGDWVWKLVATNEFNYTPGCMIELMWSKQVIISGLTLVNSTFWNVHPIYCERVFIHGLMITAPDESENTDGVAINSCRRVIVEDCQVSTGDDAISIKSGWDQYGIRFAMPSEKIKIRSLTVGNSHGVSIGSELSGGVRKVVVNGVRFLGGSERGFRVKTTVGRGGLVRDIIVMNMDLRDVYRAAIEFNTNYSSNSFTHPDDQYDRTAYTEIRDIIIEHLTGVNCTQIGQFKAIPEAPIKRLHLKDFFFTNTTKPDPYLCSNTTGTQLNVIPQAPLECFSEILQRRGRTRR